jgi:hypothetical protein
MEVLHLAARVESRETGCRMTPLPGTGYVVLSRTRAILLAAAVTFLLGACASAPQLPTQPRADGAFVIERDLLGSAVARGEFSAINGVRRSFTAYLDGTRAGDTFTLRERFEYDDGERDHKTWILTLKGDGTYIGTREDVIGEARGWQDGPTFRLEYDIRLPTDNGEPGMKVRFRDVMWKTADGRVLNHAVVGKWGLRVGTVKLVIEPPSRAPG